MQHNTEEWGCSWVILDYILNLTQVDGGITGVNGVMHKRMQRRQDSLEKRENIGNCVLFNLLAWGGVRSQLSGLEQVDVTGVTHNTGQRWTGGLEVELLE